MNDNDLTPAQEDAVQAFGAAARLMAGAWPLPDVPFLTGMSGGERHAIDRDFFVQSRSRHGGMYTQAECGRPVLYASQYPVYAGDWPPHVRWCADCAWTVAAREGDLDRQLRALTPSNDDREALSPLMADPLIAVNAAMSIVKAAAATRQWDREPTGPEIIRVLAAITRHAPVVLLDEECADGDCEHGRRRRDGSRACGAAVACRACSVQADPEDDRAFLPECTIPAPCPPLTALAAHAERELAEAIRREQQLAGITTTAGESH